MNWRQWSWKQWSAAAVSALTFVGLVGQAIGAAPLIEPYLMASRAYVRNAIDVAMNDVSGKLGQTTIALLDLKATTLDASLAQLRTQLNMVLIRLRDAPADSFLLNLQDALVHQINDAEDSKKNVICQKRALELGRQVC